MDASTRAVVTPAGIRLASSGAELRTTGRRASVDVTEADGTIRRIIRDDLSNLAAGIIGSLMVGARALVRRLQRERSASMELAADRIAWAIEARVTRAASATRDATELGPSPVSE